MKSTRPSGTVLVISFFLLICMLVGGIVFRAYHGSITLMTPQQKHTSALTDYSLKKKEITSHPDKKSDLKAKNDLKVSQLNQKRAAIDNYLHRIGFSGSAVVVSHGEVVLDKGYGFRNLRLKAPNLPSTEYYIGSMTKSVTAVAFMQMQEQGLISFNSRVSAYYPGFPHGRDISMIDLLCHMSGLHPHVETARSMTRDQLVSHIAAANIMLLSKPGTQYAYADVNYALLAAILDKICMTVDHESLHHYIQQHIFQPTGMQHAGFGTAMQQSPYASIAYARRGPVYATTWLPSFTQLLGCGDVYASAWNMYLFDHALSTSRLVSRKSYQMIFTRHFSNVKYTLGWYINREGWGNHVYSNHGVLAGWNGSNAFSADGENYVVLLMNINNPAMDLGKANSMIFSTLTQ
ncbi:serine hydrolase domain-containing protein [Sporolactobacillus pectinivorans]|uniref:serine hydrolase domain-containing protein n=1 Tax=Sporolactobacillus pectinivorans TaxID=1591408 RepID=UPI0012FD710B|nr:serine hydrolase domain-containing protein [Sporolactobacillus pectinivorans]